MFHNFICQTILLFTFDINNTFLFLLIKPDSFFVLTQILVSINLKFEGNQVYLILFVNENYDKKMLLDDN